MLAVLITVTRFCQKQHKETKLNVGSRFKGIQSIMAGRAKVPGAPWIMARACDMPR